MPNADKGRESTISYKSVPDEASMVWEKKRELQPNQKVKEGKI